MTRVERSLEISYLATTATARCNMTSQQGKYLSNDDQNVFSLNDNSSYIARRPMLYNMLKRYQDGKPPMGVVECTNTHLASSTTNQQAGGCFLSGTLCSTRMSYAALALPYNAYATESNDS